MRWRALPADRGRCRRRACLRACLTLIAVSRPPSALIRDSNAYPQTYPQVRGRILAILDGCVKIPNLQTADFIAVSGRPRTSTNRGRRRECYSKQNSLLVVQGNPAYLGVQFAVQTTSPHGTAGACLVRTARPPPMSAFAVAIGGKVDMAYCAAHVCL